MADKEKKAKKPKKEAKKFPAKKMPGMFKKSYSEKKLEKKVLNRLYVPSDKKEVMALFEKGANAKKPELMAMSRERQFTKAELKHFKSLSKQIKAQKSIFSFVPFAAVVGIIVGVGVIVTAFKNPIAKKVLVSVCESMAGAKTEIRSVNLEIFGTSLTVNHISVGNKNSEMKNIFEAEKIEVAFSLTQALRGRFDCKNIEVSGMAFNTDRTTSCRLPLQKLKEKKAEKENAESAFMIAVKERSNTAMERLKTQAATMLGGSSPEEIVKNLESQLKTPAAVKDAKDQSEAMIAKWKSKPDEMKKEVESFSASVKDLQKLDKFMEGKPVTVHIAEIDQPDVPLWAVWALQQYAKEKGKEACLKKYGKFIKDVVMYVKCNHHPNLKLMPNGLLYTDGKDKAVTWMNSTANGHPVVPRTGYIVEFNALWYNALCFCASLCELAGKEKDQQQFLEAAELAKQSFLDTFLNEYGYLYDYVDGKMIDWSVRPNMIFPVAFDYSPLSQDQKKRVLDICTRELLTPKGLRSLSPKSGGYNPVYVGPQSQRDYAYHQGTAWPWLGGFYMEATLKMYKRTRLSFIERQMVGYDDEMSCHCLGTISELFDGNPPFTGRGAISFAMNVAEILRALELLEKYQY